MKIVRLDRPDDFAGWRAAAREHVRAGTPPEDIVWQQPYERDLFADSEGETSIGLPARYRIPTVPRSFVDLAERVVCHQATDRFARLYRVLWRVAVGGEQGLWTRFSDPDMHYLHTLGKNVARERHKMHAFVRFRQTPPAGHEHFHAWFEPEHHTLRLSVPFFVRRFANMHWSIVTPAESAHWDGSKLVFGPGGQRCSGPEDDAFEPLWRTYFSSIFNPARLMVDAMQSEMPVRYWKNMPEGELIQALVGDAGSRTASMLAAGQSPAAPQRSDQ